MQIIGTTRGMSRNISKNTLVALPIFLGALVAIGLNPAHAATSATSTATLTMDNFASVSTSGNISLTPAQADFEAGFVEQAGAVTFNVVTNDSTGCTVSVQGAASPTLSNSDLLIKSATSGSAITAYTATPSTSTALWSTSSAQPNGTSVTVDVRVQNLRTYAGGAAGAGSTATYTNTLTFDVLPNS